MCPRSRNPRNLFETETKALAPWFMPLLLSRRAGMKRFTILFLAEILSISVLLSPGADAQPRTTTPPVTHQDIGAEPGHLPKAHYVPSRTTQPYPVWIEKSMLLNPDRSVNTNLVPPPGVAAIKTLRRTPAEGGCVRVGAAFEDTMGIPPRETIEEGTRNSRLIVLGRVTEKAYGFQVDVPGQLLRVVPEETLKGVPRDVPAYFVFVPVATFHLDAMPLCKTDDRFADPPEVGDEVLLFAPSEPDRHEDEREPFFELEDDRGLVTLHSSDVVSLPRAWRSKGAAKSSPLTRGGLLERVHLAIGLKDEAERSDYLPEEELVRGRFPSAMSMVLVQKFGRHLWLDSPHFVLLRLKGVLPA